VPHMVARGIVAYLIFTNLADVVLQRAVTSAGALAVAVLALGTLASVLAVRRMRYAPLVTLTFEDELPTDVMPLRLNAD
jgi:hypothetical protein